MMQDRLTGEVALVTGAAKGIGFAIAERMAAAGATVALSDVDGDGVAHAASRLGDRVSAHVLDTTDRDGITEHVREVTALHGTPTVLVNNAGIQRVGASESLPREWWDEVVAVNLTGVFDCIQEVVPGMLAAGHGSIINLASANSEVGMPGRAPYCATKTGIVGLTRALGVEWASRGVRVNAIEPGYVLTPMVQAAIDDGLLDEPQLLDRIPMRRLASIDDIGNAAVFLASAEASYITGQTLAVDGGFLAYGAPRPTSELPEQSYAF